MARAFDSGLVAPRRTLLRQSIAAALSSLSHAGGQYLAAVLELPWPVSWSEGADEVGHWIDVVRGRSPVAGVALGGCEWQPQGGAGESWAGELSVSVYLASGNTRGHLARVAGDVVGESDHQRDPGLEVIGEHVFERLAGVRFPAIGCQLVPQRDRWAWVSQELTVLELTLVARLHLLVNPDRDELTVHSSLDARHSDTTADPVELRAVSEVP